MTEIIAIDGPASVGKSTLAKKISIYYNSPFLNSGRLYRAVALKIKLNLVDLNDENKILKIAESLDEDDLSSKQLFLSGIDKIASKISKKKYLRDQLIAYQREFPKKYAKGNKFAIIEGRDIGTEIFPSSKFKFFLWGDAKIRAKRRYQQIRRNGQKARLKHIYEEIIARDNEDLNRIVAPLKPAVNSVLLDTSYLDIEQVFNVIKKILNK